MNPLDPLINEIMQIYRRYILISSIIFAEQLKSSYLMSAYHIGRECVITHALIASYFEV